MSPKLRLMQAALAVAVAATWVWLGMVLAISFLEAPLKFRAPGVTLQLGLGIGRLVFRALNTCEAVLAVVVAVVWTAVVAFVAMLIVKAVFGGARVSESSETDGLDLSSHGERAYNY